MSNLRKREIGNAVSNETGIAQRSVYDVIQRTFDHITEALACGNRVELRNFGVFEVRVGKPRVGRNPRTPLDTFTVPSRPRVKFAAGKAMLERVGEMPTARGDVKPVKR